MKPDFGNPLTRPRGEYSLKVEQVAGDDHVWVVWLLPSNEQLKSRGFALDESNASPCVIMTLDARNARFMIHPFYTALDQDGSYTNKYSWPSAHRLQSSFPPRSGHGSVIAPAALWTGLCCGHGRFRSFWGF